MNATIARHAMVLGLLTAVGPVAIDMYLPAFPAIAHDLRTSEGAVQATLVSFFVALSLGQAVYGPIADMFGRRRPIFAGMALFIAASIACSTAESVAALTFYRFLQGLGGCAGMVLARAIVRDLYSGTEAARLFSLVLLVLGVSPLLAPIVGSGLIALFPWTAIFWAVAAFGLLATALLALLIPETLPEERRIPGGLASALRTYSVLLFDRRFTGLVMVAALAHGAMLAYIAGSSFVFIELFGVSPAVYSLLFAFNASALIGGAQFNVKLIRRFGAQRLVQGSASVMAAATGLLLLASATHVNSVAVTAALLFVSVGCIGFIGPPVSMLALERYAGAAGSASALLGTLQFGLGALSSALVSLLSNGAALPMAAVMAACALSSAALAWRTLKPRPMGGS